MNPKKFGTIDNLKNAYFTSQVSKATMSERRKNPSKRVKHGGTGEAKEVVLSTGTQNLEDMGPMVMI